MQLLSIKIAGFKSFADPVTIHIPKALCGIVGPNGSGKSNVIDAMRWVVGESSAKSLRGGTLDDVIFNGSAKRKPAGQASVELLFDNSLSRCSGQWEKYAEISIRRTVTRDGVSEYFINGTRARRRDVKELFLGTGFGPRSYSIIEQGMISRIVEGKPEDLSAFIEEASGVSRFREKRHETHLKMNRVEENLSRLDDMRHEISKRIRQLKYQAEQARRYTRQKENHNALRIQLLAYEWRDLNRQVQAMQNAKSELDLMLEQRTASVRATEADLEKIRQRRLELESNLTDVQMELFRINAEIADCDRRIQESNELVERARTELRSMESQLDEIDKSKAEQTQRVEFADSECRRIESLVNELQSNLQVQQRQLAREEAQLSELQSHSEQIEQRVIDAVRRRESAAAALVHNQRTMESVIADLECVNTEIGRRETILTDEVDDESNINIERTTQLCGQLRFRIGEIESDLANRRLLVDQKTIELETLRESAREVQVQLGTLERSLAASTTDEDAGFSNWLLEHKLNDAKALYLSVKVTDGWDRAVDRVLGKKLSALCVDDLLQISQTVGERTFATQHHFVAGANHSPTAHPDSLSRFVESPNQIAETLLSGVYTAESVPMAMAMQSQLGAHESVVTPDGSIVGANWYSPAVGQDEPTGMLEMASRVRELRNKVVQWDAVESEIKQEISNNRNAIADLERELGETRRHLASEIDALEHLRARQSANEVQRLQSITKLQELTVQAQQLRESQTSLEAEQAQSSEVLQTQSDALAVIERERAVESVRAKTQSQTVKDLQSAVSDAVRECHYLELEAQKFNSDRLLASSALSELEHRRQTLETEKTTLESKLGNEDDPTKSLQVDLAKYVVQKQSVEDELTKVRNQIETVEVQRRQFDEQRMQNQLDVETVNLKLQEQNAQLGRLSAQSEEIRQKLADRKADAESECAKLDEAFEYEQTYQKFEKLKRQIENTGSINLVAVDQYDQEMERKTYMDYQHEDLTRAMNTLQQTIKKIDQESRERYGETFAVVNSEFQRLLPKLFGGGSGHLELIGEYPENAGVRIFARPKGKRIHNIQALSGGEKALTAVALILSFFQLNPSPVCLLDEIDAPLDDENVFRLCDSLHALSNTTQLILITHNKITMESVDTLIGVTMPEPNVSKLLSVDLLAAQEFAA